MKVQNAKRNRRGGGTLPLDGLGNPTPTKNRFLPVLYISISQEGLSPILENLNTVIRDLQNSIGRDS